MALERQSAGRVVLPEHRHAAEEDEVEPALRVDDRQPGVQSEVDLAIGSCPVVQRSNVRETPPSMAHSDSSVPSSG